MNRNPWSLIFSRSLSYSIKTEPIWEAVSQMHPVYFFGLCQTTVVQILLFHPCPFAHTRRTEDPNYTHVHTVIHFGLLYAK